MKGQDDILKRYYRGETSLEEERFLRQAFREGQLPEDPTLAFGNQSVEVPEQLMKNIRHTIRLQKAEHKRQIRIILGSMAACLLLLLCLKVFITPAYRQNDSLPDNIKRERFENAIRLIGEALEDPVPKKPEKIIYEDKDVIIAVQ